jgi:hypothetical protein
MIGCSPPLTVDKNFKFFALAYLSDWWQYDADFVSRLAPGKTSRRECLVEAATYYQVIRSFSEKREDSESPIMTKALQILDETVVRVNRTITHDNVDTLVTGLAKELRTAYPPPTRQIQEILDSANKKKAQNIKKEAPGLISAASKFLWLLHRAPVVVYDDRACRCLNGLGGTRFSTEDYTAYRAGWHAQFEHFESDILQACGELGALESFAPGDDAKGSLKSDVSEQWFRERVFDKFLWWNGKKPRRSA